MLAEKLCPLCWPLVHVASKENCLTDMKDAKEGLKKKLDDEKV